MDIFNDIKDCISQYDHLGKMVLKNGTILVGKAPHIAEFAWLHKLFFPLKKADIQLLEKELSTDIPKSYEQFLLTFGNGYSIFCSTFSLDGLRNMNSRSDDFIVQPFSIKISNIFERPKNSRDEYFFIGGYKLDGSKLYIDTTTGKVHYCKKTDATSLYSWNSFEDMFIAETKRIFSLFDKNGFLIGPKNATLPILI